MFLMSCSDVSFLSCSLVSFGNKTVAVPSCLCVGLLCSWSRLTCTNPLYNALYLALQRTLPHLSLTLYRDIHLNNALYLDNALVNENAEARAQGGVGAHAHWNRLSHQQTSSKIRSRLHWGCSASNLIRLGRLEHCSS
jgi:hypothetical protein